VKLGAVDIALTTHAVGRASVVGNTRLRRCFCAHLLARQPTSLTLAYTHERSKCEARCRRGRPNHACRAGRASVVSNTRDRTCLCAHLLATGSLHPLLSLTCETSKCGAIGAVEITLTTHAARRASVVSNTRDRTCLCAHLLARQPTSLTRLLTREVSMKLGAVEIALTAHAARRASVVSDTGDRRCLCAHILARQPTSL